MSQHTDRILTGPNLISFARLLGVPLFLYLLLVRHADAAATAVLAAGGTSDWLDGWLARRTGQVSRLGELLDPLADRLYIAATLVGFTLRDVVPWQFTAALVARDVVMAVLLLTLRRAGFAPPPVHYLGKAATFVLLAAFPLLLLAAAAPVVSPVVAPAGWALAWWGLGTYWLAAFLYVGQARQALRARRVRP
ncbi:MAG TPA: CDP-alcohol phosphatidyltransferase family protein [Pilimelia sp.]|nr:CDP-alcohol phosphatidyltransferase family protein [Pilimelia sp.]